MSPAVDEKTKLAVRFTGQFRQAPGCLRRDDLLRLGLAPPQAFESPQLGRFQSCCLSLDLCYLAASGIGILNGSIQELEKNV
jgi:hypothetical protein